MTDTQLTIIIAAIAPTLTALGALVVGILNSVKASATKAAVAANDVKTDEVIAKTVEIHNVSNGHLSRVTTALEIANTKINGLERMVTSLIEAKVIADKLASEKPTQAPVPTEVVVVNPPTEPVPTVVQKENAAPLL